MKIKTGKYEIVKSGIIHSHNLDDILFNFTSPFKANFTVSLNIDANSTPSTTLFPSGNHELKITFNNPNGLNFGPASMTELGETDDFKIFGVFRINTFGTPPTSYELKYTFYKEDFIR